MLKSITLKATLNSNPLTLTVFSFDDDLFVIIPANTYSEQVWLDPETTEITQRSVVKNNAVKENIINKLQAELDNPNSFTIFRLVPKPKEYRLFPIDTSKTTVRTAIQRKLTFLQNHIL